MKAIQAAVRLAVREAREKEGATFSDLLYRFKLSRSTIYAFIKDCDNSRVQDKPRSRRVAVVIAKERPQLSKGDLGEAARQMIAARLMLAGIKIFRPLSEDTSTDLLVLSQTGTVHKCQCKYIYPTKNGQHHMSLYSSRNARSGKTTRHFYSSVEVDFFLGYCLDNDTVYVIPFDDAKGRSDLVFWVLRKPQGRNQRIRFDFATYAGAYHFLQ